MILLKHGWQPVWTTSDELTGPTRKGGIFCLAKAMKALNQNKFEKLIKNDPRDQIKDILFELEQNDLKWP